MNQVLLSATRLFRTLLALNRALLVGDGLSSGINGREGGFSRIFLEYVPVADLCLQTFVSYVWVIFVREVSNSRRRGTTADIFLAAPLAAGVAILLATPFAHLGFTYDGPNRYVHTAGHDDSPFDQPPRHTERTAFSRPPDGREQPEKPGYRAEKETGRKPERGALRAHLYRSRRPQGDQRCLGPVEGDRDLEASRAHGPENAFITDDVISRDGGGEFIVIADIGNEDDIDAIKRSLADQFSKRNDESDKPWKVLFSAGSISCAPGSFFPADQRLRPIDSFLYQSRNQKKGEN